MSKTTVNNGDQNQNDQNQNPKAGFHPIQAANAAGKRVGDGIGKVINKPFTIKGIVKAVGLLAIGAAGATAVYKKTGKFDAVNVNFKVIEIPEAPGCIKVSKVDGKTVEEIETGENPETVTEEAEPVEVSNGDIEI